MASEMKQQFCDDEWFDDKVGRLHQLARLGYGQNIQAHIDTYLPAVAFIGCVSSAPVTQEMRKFARRMVLCISDAPQEGTLPDLGAILRGVMLGHRVVTPRNVPKASTQQATPRNVPKASTQPQCGDFPYTLKDDCYISHMLLQALPCIKRPNRKDSKKMQGYQIGLNILLGMLLGLYPSAIKFPPFHVRVVVYSSIHRLLTNGGGKMFCDRHPMLMTMAFMEYCAYVIQTYLPAEFDVISREPGMSTYFVGVPLACDVFRQEMLNNMESGRDIVWSLLEEHCTVVVDKHTRACKNKVKTKREDHGLGVKVELDVVRAFSSLPFVTPYDVHLEDSGFKVMGSELAMLDQSCEESEGVGVKRVRHQYEAVAAMQRLLRVSSLPANVIRMQLRSLRACMGVCERSALDGVTLYICASCGLGNTGAARSIQTRGQCRLDGVEWFGGSGDARPTFVCSHCQMPAMIAVNTLGRIVALRGQRFYLAPCCGTVQVYRGTGVEFQSEYCLNGIGEGSRSELSRGVTLHSCSHQRIKSQSRPQRARCEVCQTTCAGAVAPECFTVIDHLAGCMRSIRLCSRHAPRQEALLRVANWRQLMDEVNKRDKPLFASTRRQ
jgi:hypothetical protein